MSKTVNDVTEFIKTLLGLGYSMKQINKVIESYSKSSIIFPESVYKELKGLQAEDILRLLFAAESQPKAENGLNTVRNIKKYKNKGSLSEYLPFIEFSTKGETSLVTRVIELFLKSNIDLLENKTLIESLSHHNDVISYIFDAEQSMYELIELLVKNNVNLKKHGFIIKNLTEDSRNSALSNVYFQYLYFLRKCREDIDEYVDVIDASRRNQFGARIGIDLIDCYYPFADLYNKLSEIGDLKKYRQVLINSHNNHLSKLGFSYHSFVKDVTTAIDKYPIFKKEEFSPQIIELLEECSSDESGKKIVELLMPQLRTNIAEHYNLKLPIRSFSQLIDSMAKSGCKEEERENVLEALLGTYDKNLAAEDIKITIVPKTNRKGYEKKTSEGSN